MKIMIGIRDGKTVTTYKITPMIIIIIIITITITILLKKPYYSNTPNRKKPSMFKDS